MVTRKPDSAGHEAPNAPGPTLQLDEIARLVTDGEVPFPEELTDDNRLRLTRLVRARYRARLVNFIARGIARDIRRADGGQTGE